MPETPETADARSDAGKPAEAAAPRGAAPRALPGARQARLRRPAPARAVRPAEHRQRLRRRQPGDGARPTTASTCGSTRCARSPASAATARTPWRSSPPPRVFGLRGRGVKVDEVDDLAFLPPGSILHWQFNHFLVFERLTRGRRRAGRSGAAAGGASAASELGRSFTGVALLLEPGEDFEPQAGEPRQLGPLPSSCCARIGSPASGSSSPRCWCSSSRWRCRC